MLADLDGRTGRIGVFEFALAEDEALILVDVGNEDCFPLSLAGEEAILRVSSTKLLCRVYS